MQTYLGIDQGSTSTKAVLLNDQGEALYTVQIAAPPRHEDDRIVEQDAQGLLHSVLNCFDAARTWTEQYNISLSAVGLSVQRSGVVAWNSRDGMPMCPMITWADTRTHIIIDEIGRGAERISLMTGIPTIAHFAAGKVRLLQKRFLNPSVHVATLDTFLLSHLTKQGSYITEDTMAARTMLYALDDRGWNEQLCRDFGVDRKRLPDISASIAHHATYQGVPIVACIGDQQAALLGRSRVTKRPLLNLGTIASLAVDTGAEVVRKTGLISSVLFSQERMFGGGREMRYLVETTSPVTGTVLLEPIRRSWATTSESLDQMCKAAAATNPAGLATAYFVNHRAVLPSHPDGVPNVTVCKLGANEADRARAIVENVGNLVVRMLEEFGDKGLLGDSFPCEIDIAGGGSELDFLVQYIADVSGHIFHRMAEREASARGAALCAWMFGKRDAEVSALNTASPIKSYRCENPERRRRYLMWQRMEKDVLNRTLPVQAEIESSQI